MSDTEDPKDSKEIVLSIDGYELRASDADDEPRILDVKLAERAGMTRATNVRTVIKRAAADKFLNEGEHFLVHVRSAPNSGRGGHRGAVTEYWLTQSGALKLITRLNTPEASALIDDMVRVYISARSQLRPALPPPTPAEAIISAHAANPERFASTKRLGDKSIWRNEFYMHFKLVAMVQGVTWRKVEGFVRAHFGVPGYLHINIGLLGELRRMCQSLATSQVMIGRSVRRLPAGSEKQIRMFN